jgi:hypothetical protein
VAALNLVVVTRPLLPSSCLRFRCSSCRVSRDTVYVVRCTKYASVRFVNCDIGTENCGAIKKLCTKGDVGKQQKVVIAENKFRNVVQFDRGFSKGKFE